MYRITLVLLMVLMPVSVYAAGWKDSVTESATLNAGDIWYTENSVATANNWVTFGTYQGWLEGYFYTKSQVDTEVAGCVKDTDTFTINLKGDYSNLLFDDGVPFNTTISGSGATVITMPTYSNTGECDDAAELGAEAYDATHMLKCRGTLGWWDIITNTAWVNEATVDPVSSFLVDWDFSAGVPSGVGSMGAPVFAGDGMAVFDYNEYIDIQFASQNSVNTAVVVNFAALDNTSDVYFSTIGATKDTVRSTGVLRTYNGSNTYPVSAETFSTATDYYIWHEFTVGTGADSIARTYVGTTGVRANATLWTESNNGNAVDPVVSIKVGQFNSDTLGNITFKRVIVSATAIGDIL